MFFLRSYLSAFSLLSWYFCAICRINWLNANFSGGDDRSSDDGDADDDVSSTFLDPAVTDTDIVVVMASDMDASLADVIVGLLVTDFGWTFLAAIFGFSCDLFDTSWLSLESLKARERENF